MSHYDPEHIARYFDAFGNKEWERLVESPLQEVKLYVHLHYLEEYVEPGSRVLDIGAGAGRFTQALADRGCSIVVADISPGQIELNREYADKRGFANAVEEWLELDICDMSALGDASFDAVVCYGGPLSYVFDLRDAALSECLRVVRGEGHILASVMSLWGTIHAALPAVLSVPEAQNAAIVRTGDLTPETLPESPHHCHLFRGEEFRGFLERENTELLVLSASNAVSTAWGKSIEEVRDQQDKWEELLRLELEACRQPGGLDMGTHLLGVVQKLA